MKKATLVFGSLSERPAGPGWEPVVMAGTGDGGVPNPSSALLAGDPARPNEDDRFSGWASLGARRLPPGAHGWVGEARWLPRAVLARLGD